MAVSEPVVAYPEAEFQKTIVSVIEDSLTLEKRQFVILERSGWMWLSSSALYGRPAQCGFWKSKPSGLSEWVALGSAIGVALEHRLTSSCLKKTSLHLFDSIVRWAYADATQHPGTPRYGLFTCGLAKKAAMRSVSRGKQNNLRVAALRPSLVGWAAFCTQIRDFLLA